MAMTREAAHALVTVLERRIAKRMAEYDAANAAWKANRESWSALDWETRKDRPAWRECQAAARDLNALCEKLHKQIRRLRQELWRAARVEEERTSNIERPTSNIEVGEKISPPGRAACAEAGCPKDTVFTPLLQGEGGLRQRSEGNRVGTLEHRTSNVELPTSKEEEGRVGA